MPILRGSIHRHIAAEFLLFGLAGFAGEHAFFGAGAALALLAAGFFDAGALGIGAFAADGFDFIEQQFPSEEAVHALLARFLAFDLNAAGAMEEHHTGGDFVDVLPAVAAGAHEGFFNITLAYAESGHALGQLIFLVGRNGE